MKQKMKEIEAGKQFGALVESKMMIAEGDTLEEFEEWKNSMIKKKVLQTRPRGDARQRARCAVSPSRIERPLAHHRDALQSGAPPRPRYAFYFSPSEKEEATALEFAKRKRSELREYIQKKSKSAAFRFSKSCSTSARKTTAS